MKYKIGRRMVVGLCVLLGSTLFAADDGGFDERPEAVRTPPPEMPADMRQQGVNGVVIVTVSLNKLGSVEDCEVKKSSRPEFEQAAIDAVRNWQFKPAKKNGKDVPAKISVPVKFSNEG